MTQLPRRERARAPLYVSQEQDAPARALSPYHRPAAIPMSALCRTPAATGRLAHWLSTVTAPCHRIMCMQRKLFHPQQPPITFAVPSWRSSLPAPNPPLFQSAAGLALNHAGASASSSSSCGNAAVPAPLPIAWTGRPCDAAGHFHRAPLRSHPHPHRRCPRRRCGHLGIMQE